MAQSTGGAQVRNKLSVSAPLGRRFAFVRQFPVVGIMGPSGSRKTTFIRSCGIEVADIAESPSPQARRKVKQIQWKSTLLKVERVLNYS